MRACTRVNKESSSCAGLLTDATFDTTCVTTCDAITESMPMDEVDKLSTTVGAENVHGDMYPPLNDKVCVQHACACGFCQDLINNAHTRESESCFIESNRKRGAFEYARAQRGIAAVQCGVVWCGVVHR